MMYKKNLRFFFKSVGNFLLIIFFLLQTVEAMMYFMPKEQLVEASEYIVVAKVQTVSNTDRVMRWREVTAKVVKNELQVIEMIKGSLSLEKPFVLYTFEYNGEMEDNVELSSKGSIVLLFLEKDEKGELKPVNGIQGVWPMNNDKFAGIGSGTTLKQIREMAQSQTNSCKSEAFSSLLDMAKTQTLASHYREALEAFRKAYRICPMKDLEEQMAWLMGKIEDKEPTFDIVGTWKRDDGLIVFFCESGESFQYGSGKVLPDGSMMTNEIITTGFEGMIVEAGPLAKYKFKKGEKIFKLGLEGAGTYKGFVEYRNLDGDKWMKIETLRVSGDKMYGIGHWKRLDMTKKMHMIQAKRSKALLGIWYFGRIFHYIKDEQEFLCKLTLTDELFDKKGYKIKSCNSDASYWRLDGETLFFMDTIGATTVKFNKAGPGYWKSNYVGRFRYYLKRLGNGANDAK